jgi:hypothetical protein
MKILKLSVKRKTLEADGEATGKNGAGIMVSQLNPVNENGGPEVSVIPKAMKV